MLNTFGVINLISKINFMKEKTFQYGSMSEEKNSLATLNEISESVLLSGGWVKKSDIEFNRYKQDCRKRALDIAHSERERGYENNSLSQQRMPIVTSPESILVNADKYYNWLISIPE